MIGYNPDALMSHMAHKQQVGDLLQSNPDPAVRVKLQALTEEAVFEKTGIKTGCAARVCLSSGVNLIGGLRHIHDHNDPLQHATVQVTGVDLWGEISYLDEKGKEGSTHVGMIALCD